MEGRNASVSVAAGVPAVPGGTVGPAVQDYDRFVADVWVCVALTLMILSCIGLLCSCMLYHKLQQWKQHGKIDLNVKQIQVCSLINVFNGTIYIAVFR